MLGPLAQDVALELAGVGARELVDDMDLAGPLMRRQPGLEMGRQRLGQAGAVGRRAGNHEGHRLDEAAVAVAPTTPASVTSGWARSAASASVGVTH